jgi:hypothetical protein
MKSTDFSQVKAKFGFGDKIEVIGTPFKKMATSQTKKNRKQRELEKSPLKTVRKNLNRMNSYKKSGRNWKGKKSTTRTRARKQISSNNFLHMER